MASKEQSVTLLRKNKRAMVAGLQSNGYDVTDTMRAADFPNYVRLGSGLLDLQVCAVKISDGSVTYFLVSDWLALTQAKRDLYLKKGLRVRALGEDFIIAPDSFSNMTLAQCRAKAAEYKAHSLEDDGVDDTFTWKLPTKHQAQIFYRYRTQINAAFSSVWSGAMVFSATWHWTQTVQSGSSYWNVNVASGWYDAVAESTARSLRLVCDPQ